LSANKYIFSENQKKKKLNSLQLSDMDALVAEIISIIEHEDIKQWAPIAAQRLSDATRTAEKNRGQVEHLLRSSAISPQKHATLYVWLLSVWASVHRVSKKGAKSAPVTVKLSSLFNETQTREFIECAERLLDSASQKQLRVLPDALVNVCHAYTLLLCENRQAPSPLRAVARLERASAILSKNVTDFLRGNFVRRYDQDDNQRQDLEQQPNAPVSVEDDKESTSSSSSSSSASSSSSSSSKRRKAPLPCYLTGIDSDLLLACVKGKCYKRAYEYLESRDLFSLHRESAGLSEQSVLLFCYYGAMACISLKHFDKALNYLQMSLAMPGQSLSGIVLAAYKKFALVSLLARGQSAEMPRYVSDSVKTRLARSTQVYRGFASAFERRNANDLHAYAQQHHGAFASDGNFGLVKQCIGAVYRLNINRLTRTFITLSLQHIGENAHLSSGADAENEIVRMVESGQIFAHIDQHDGMVQFDDEPEQYDSSVMVQHVSQRIAASMELSRRIQGLDDTVSADHSYLKQLLGIRELPHHSLANEHFSTF
jgi:COP9 signalosome complex subunit 3, N-terminal helical repeats/PCI domain